MEACGDGHLKAAKLLINSGANLALRSAFGRSPLDAAELRVYLNENPDEDADENEATDAQRAEHKALVKFLRQRGAA